MKASVLFISFILFAIPGFVHTDETEPPKTKFEISREYVQELLVQKAMEFLGTPYRYAGTTKDGVDCSGFVFTVYRAATGKTISRMASELYKKLPVVQGPLYPGDLLFFNTTGGVSHVGMSIGGDKMIHAASAGPETGVIISSLKEKYYQTRYLGARRVFQYTSPTIFVTLGTTKIMTALQAPFLTGHSFKLSVAHKIPGGRTVHATATLAGKKEPAKEVRIGAGKEIEAAWTLPEAGDWVISFTEEGRGEIARIEVRVEHGFKG